MSKKNIKKRVRCFLSSDLFNLYSETILRELEVLLAFIIGRNKVNNIKYADDSVLMADQEQILNNIS